MKHRVKKMQNLLAKVFYFIQPDRYQAKKRRVSLSGVGSRLKFTIVKAAGYASVRLIQLDFQS